jgi:hypothetical protein
MRRRPIPLNGAIAVQLVVLFGFAISWFLLPAPSRATTERLTAVDSSRTAADITRRAPLVIESLYDDPEVVSNQELAAVLKQLRPKFSPQELKPNHVEHALRTWGVAATFPDPEVLSGVALRDVLIDHASFLRSWNSEIPPLLEDRPAGVAIRFDREPGGSVHHDHWLASLTEAGIALDEPVFAPARRNMTVNDVLQESLRDFRLDERETEWSALAFGLWLPPTRTWTTSTGREISFDRIGRRLIRGHQRFGVCSGTHRVYSLAVLLRLDEEFDILSDDLNREIVSHLQYVRDLISVSQNAEGYWPSNWSAGAAAVENPIEELEYKRVIATGHHLEWLAIAPKELHPPREQILKAADWVIQTTVGHSEEDIRGQYTFYSHVANALSLWRGTRPAEFWRSWRVSHPFAAEGGPDTGAAKDPGKT